MPDLEVVAAINKLSSKLDAQAVETRQVIASLAKRQEDTERERSLQEFKGMRIKSNLDSRVDAIGGSLQALHQELQSGVGRREVAARHGYGRGNAASGLGWQQPLRAGHVSCFVGGTSPRRWRQRRLG